MADNEMQDSGATSFDEDVSFSIPGFDPEPAEGTDAQQSVETDEQAKDVTQLEAATAPHIEDAPAEQADEAPAQPAARKLKFKAGDAETELEETAEVAWKVDGKTVPVKLRDLLDNYSGKVAYDRKFQDLASEKKRQSNEAAAFRSEQDKHKSLVTDMYDKVRSGKRFEAIQNLIEVSGLKVDPREYIKHIRESFLVEAQELANLTPEQREMRELQEEREWLKSQYERMNQRTQTEEAQRAFQTRMATVAEHAGIPFDEFAQTHEWLKAQVRTNGGDPNSVTPERTVEHKRSVQAYEKAREAIAAADPSLVVDGIVTDEAKWDKLAALAKANPQVSTEDFVAAYQETRKATQQKAVAKKLAKAPVSTPAKGATRKSSSPLDTAVDFTKITQEDSIW